VVARQLFRLRNATTARRWSCWASAELLRLALREGSDRGSGSCSRPWCCRYSSPMKAAVRTSYGPPEVVRIAAVEKPTAKDSEVLVKVHATTVNRTDCGLRAAKPFIMRFFNGSSGRR
jgi:hypothetical protein